jgi:hypothetical protein
VREFQTCRLYRTTAAKDTTASDLTGLSIRCDGCVLCARSVRELQNFSARGNANDEKDQAHHEEEKEQEFRDSRCGRGDAGKSKQGGDERDDEKNYSPT